MENAGGSNKTIKRKINLSGRKGTRVER